jgi:hypothetical protein
VAFLAVHPVAVSSALVDVAAVSAVVAASTALVAGRERRQPDRQGHQDQ